MTKARIRATLKEVACWKATSDLRTCDVLRYLTLFDEHSKVVSESRLVKHDSKQEHLDWPCRPGQRASTDPQLYSLGDLFNDDPLIATGARALGEFFEAVVRDRPRFRVDVHRIIASGDYVWAHVNFTNLHTDEPGDLGVVGVDIYRFNSEGKVAEHWDALQAVPNSFESANSNGMF